MHQQKKVIATTQKNDRFAFVEGEEMQLTAPVIKDQPERKFRIAQSRLNKHKSNKPIASKKKITPQTPRPKQIEFEEMPGKPIDEPEIESQTQEQVQPKVPKSNKKHLKKALAKPSTPQNKSIQPVPTKTKDPLPVPKKSGPKPTQEPEIQDDLPEELPIDEESESIRRTHSKPRKIKETLSDASATLANAGSRIGAPLGVIATHAATTPTLDLDHTIDLFNQKNHTAQLDQKSAEYESAKQNNDLWERLANPDKINYETNEQQNFESTHPTLAAKDNNILTQIQAKEDQVTEFNTLLSDFDKPKVLYNGTPSQIDPTKLVDNPAFQAKMTTYETSHPDIVTLEQNKANLTKQITEFDNLTNDNAYYKDPTYQAEQTQYLSTNPTRVTSQTAIDQQQASLTKNLSQITQLSDDPTYYKDPILQNDQAAYLAKNPQKVTDFNTNAATLTQKTQYQTDLRRLENDSTYSINNLNSSTITSDQNKVAQIQSLETQKSTLETQITDCDTRIAAFRQYEIDNPSQILYYENQIKIQQADEASYNTSLTNIKSQLNQLNTDRNTLLDQAAGLSDITFIEYRLSTVNTSITNLDKQIAIDEQTLSKLDPSSAAYANLSDTLTQERLQRQLSLDEKANIETHIASYETQLNSNINSLSASQTQLLDSAITSKDYDFIKYRLSSLDQSIDQMQAQIATDKAALAKLTPGTPAYQALQTKINTETLTETNLETEKSNIIVQIAPTQTDLQNQLTAQNAAETKLFNDAITAKDYDFIKYRLSGLDKSIADQQTQIDLDKQALATKTPGTADYQALQTKINTETQTKSNFESEKAALLTQIDPVKTDLLTQNVNLETTRDNLLLTDPQYAEYRLAKLSTKLNDIDQQINSNQVSLANEKDPVKQKSIEDLITTLNNQRTQIQTEKTHIQNDLIPYINQQNATINTLEASYDQQLSDAVKSNDTQYIQYRLIKMNKELTDLDTQITQTKADLNKLTYGTDQYKALQTQLDQYQQRQTELLQDREKLIHDIKPLLDNLNNTQNQDYTNYLNTATVKDLPYLKNQSNDLNKSIESLQKSIQKDKSDLAKMDANTNEYVLKQKTIADEQTQLQDAYTKHDLVNARIHELKLEATGTISQSIGIAAGLSAGGAFVGPIIAPLLFKITGMVINGIKRLFTQRPVFYQPFKPARPKVTATGGAVSASIVGAVKGGLAGTVAGPAGIVAGVFGGLLVGALAGGLAGWAGGKIIHSIFVRKD